MKHNAWIARYEYPQVVQNEPGECLFFFVVAGKDELWNWGTGSIGISELSNAVSGIIFFLSGTLNTSGFQLNAGKINHKHLHEVSQTFITACNKPMGKPPDSSVPLGLHLVEMHLAKSVGSASFVWSKMYTRTPLTATNVQRRTRYFRVTTEATCRAVSSSKCSPWFTRICACLAAVGRTEQILYTMDIPVKP